MKKIAVITGASSGMGRDFVRMIDKIEDCDEIWVIARRKEKLEEITSETGKVIRPIELDLSKEKNIKAYGKMLKDAGEIEVTALVNAAGFGKFGDFESIPLQEQMNMIDLNCKALVMMTRLALPYMDKGSHILQLDSLSAFQPVPYITTYGASKAFVLSYSRAMNRELKSRGIRVMAMNPGWVKTEFFNHAFQTNESEVQYFNRLYEAADVVKTGLRDLYKSKKDYSVHGLPVKLQVLSVKLVPHRFVMDIWLNQQKKAKNNHGLTVEGRK